MKSSDSTIAGEVISSDASRSESPSENPNE